MMTDQSDARHLGLIFFDILLYNSQSLLLKPYSHRRTLLESIIHLNPGKVLLATRYPIHPSPSNPEVALSQLQKIFANHIADHREGLVLKAANARYNDVKLPWIKLKKDYIPGYGDSLDLLIVGARWDKERARELRGEEELESKAV